MPLIRQAFVLGAGMGLRLRPMTEEKPKPLVPIFHKPLITFSLDHLRAAGVESFAINTHRLAEQFNETFASGSYQGVPLRLLHEPDLLETGGGIKNAEQALRSEPFIVYSGDILTDIDLEELIAEHFAQRNDVTLALRETGLGRSVAFRDRRVVDIGGKLGHAGSYDFANVSIWNPEVFARIPAATKISFVPILVKWISEGGRIGGVILNERKWFNIGSRDGYLEVHRTIAQENWRPFYLEDKSWPHAIEEGSQVAKSAKLEGFNAISAGCIIGDNAVVENSVLWPGAEIAAGSEVRNCIVRSGRKAEGISHGRDL